jgi:hypothetical protein
VPLPSKCIYAFSKHLESAYVRYAHSVQACNSRGGGGTLYAPTPSGHGTCSPGQECTLFHLSFGINKTRRSEPKIKTPCSQVKVNRRHGGTCRIHLQSPACCLLHADFLRGLLFKPEDGGDMLLRNVGYFSPDYTAL